MQKQSAANLQQSHASPGAKEDGDAIVLVPDVVDGDIPAVVNEEDILVCDAGHVPGDVNEDETSASNPKQFCASPCAQKEGDTSVLVQEVSVGDASHVPGDVVEEKCNKHLKRHVMATIF